MRLGTVMFEHVSSVCLVMDKKCSVTSLRLRRSMNNAQTCPWYIAKGKNRNCGPRPVSYCLTHGPWPFLQLRHCDDELAASQGHIPKSDTAVALCLKSSPMPQTKQLRLKPPLTFCVMFWLAAQLAGTLTVTICTPAWHVSQLIAATRGTSCDSHSVIQYVVFLCVFFPLQSD